MSSRRKEGKAGIAPTLQWEIASYIFSRELERLPALPSFRGARAMRVMGLAPVIASERVPSCVGIASTRLGRPSEPPLASPSSEGRATQRITPTRRRSALTTCTQGGIWGHFGFQSAPSV